MVWDSAACKPSAAKPVRFTLGVPQVLTLAWNPKAAGPAGCAGSLPAGTPGTLDAVAMSDGQSSPVHAFKLGSLSAERGLQGLAHVFHLDDLHRGTGLEPAVEPAGTIAWRKPIRSASATRRGTPATLRTSPARPTSPTTMTP